MDRREALKKLAIGGAIAAGGSVVLSSNAVAATSSGPGIPGVPAAGQALPGVVLGLTSGDRELTFTAPTPEAGVNAVYAWNILGYSVSQPNVVGVRLTSGGQVAEQLGQPLCLPNCGYTSGGQTATTETIFKNSNARDKKFQSGDTVDVGLMVTWSASGQESVTAEYVLRAVIGTGLVSSSMVPGSYYPAP